MATNNTCPPLNSCRLCLAVGTPQIEIFSDEGVQLNIAGKINDLFPFEVARNDGLPRNVCCKCVLKLDLYHNLHRTVCSTNATLNYYMKLRPVLGIKGENDSGDSGVDNVNKAGGHGADSSPSTSEQNNVGWFGADFAAYHKILTAIENLMIKSASLDMPGNLQSNGSIEGEVSSAQKLNSTSTENKNIVKNNKQHPTTTKKTQCVCYKCHEKFETKALLKLHYCNTQVSSQVSNPSSHAAHKKNHFEEQSVSCKKCYKCHEKFETKALLKLHDCNTQVYSQVNNPSSLAAHKKNHFEEPSVSWKKCGDVFTTRKALKNRAEFDCHVKTQPIRSTKSSHSSSRAASTTTSLCDGECNSYSMKKHSSPKKCAAKEIKQNNKLKGRTNAKAI